MGFFTGLLFIGGKVLDFTKETVTWFINVMPPSLKFIFFLYLVIFSASMIVPKIVDTTSECNSEGIAYKLNTFDKWQDEFATTSLMSYCGIKGLNQQYYTPYDGILQWWRGVVDGGGIKTMSGTFFQGNSTDSEQICNEFRSELNLIGNLTYEQITIDYILTKYGEKIETTDYKNIIHVQCSWNEKKNEWYPTIYVYSIDIFSFELWLTLGVVSSLAWFAVWWYSVTIKR